MKILCLGSLNLDYVYRVDHFVRAGETIASQSRSEYCGGKGLNQSIALARAGAETYHAGKIGDDGMVLKLKLMQCGVHTDLVLVDSSMPTGHAMIQVDDRGQNCIIIHGGANKAINTTDIDGVMAGFSEGDIVLLQNETNNLSYAIERAHRGGLRVALNPSPIDNELAESDALQYVEWFILNEIEGFELTGERDPMEICRTLRQKYPGCRVVLTLGREGVLYHDGEQTACHGIYDVPVVDTTAAGDTFAGYFLACVAEDLPVARALELASKASSMAVSTAGASDSIPARADVESAQLKLQK